MKKDQIYNECYAKPADFKFSSAIAGVFDDMVNRSVLFMGNTTDDKETG
jgi:hypothetical protein